MLSEKYKCDQPGKTEFLVAPLDNGHFITGVVISKTATAFKLGRTVEIITSPMLTDFLALLGAS